MPRAVRLVTILALAALAALCTAGAAVDECSAEAREAALDAASYVRAGQEALVQRLSQPVKESLRSKLGQGVVLERWDGARGTAEEHASWMLSKTRELVSPDAPGFKPWGAHEGVTYEMHEVLSAEAGGAGLFRLSGTIEIPPELATALLMHAGYLGLMDETVINLEFLKTYADRRTSLCLWQAAPGFPFVWRDGLDVSSFHRDSDGVWWQVAVSVPNEMVLYDSSASLRAVDRYWGYRLEPTLSLAGRSSTKLTLICQTTLGGWIPTFFVNRAIGDVLAAYVGTVEKQGKELLACGAADALIAAVRARAS